MSIFSIDCETIGLYGETFAVGVCVIDSEGKEIETLFLRADHNLAKGTPSSKKWIEENVIPTLYPINCETLKELRDKFWNFYMNCKLKYPGIIFMADCGVPVESSFFKDCIMDDLENRMWEGPFPLHENGTLLLLCGKNPQSTFERLPNELPAHNPLADARQSARIWFENRNLIN